MAATFARHAAWNAISNATRMVATAAQEFGCRWLLLPEAYGVWALANVIRRLAGVADPGLCAAAVRDLPRIEETISQREAGAYRWTVLLVQAGLKAATSLVIILWAILHVGQSADTPRVAVFAAAVLVWCYGVTDLLVAYLQSAERYRSLALNTITYSLASTVVPFAGAYQFGLNGLVAGTMFTLCVWIATMAWSVSRQRAGLVRTWRIDQMKAALGFAIPIRLADAPLLVLADIDSVLVANFLGVAALGVYSTAKLFLNQAITTSTWISSVVIVRVNRLAGTASGRDLAVQQVQRYVVTMDLVILPLMIVGASVLAPPLIGWFIPKYSASADVLLWSLPTMYFVPQTTLIRNFWIFDRRVGRLALSNVVGLAAAAAATMAIGKWRGWTIQGVAVGYLVGHAVYYGWIMMTAGREVLGARAARVRMAHTFVSCAWVEGALAITRASVDMASQGHMTVAAKMFGIALCLVGPLVVYGTAKSRLVPALLQRSGVPVPAHE